MIRDRDNHEFPYEITVPLILPEIKDSNNLVKFHFKRDIVSRSEFGEPVHVSFNAGNRINHILGDDDRIAFFPSHFDLNRKIYCLYSAHCVRDLSLNYFEIFLAMQRVCEGGNFWEAMVKISLEFIQTATVESVQAIPRSSEYGGHRHGKGMEEAKRIVREVALFQQACFNQCDLMIRCLLAFSDVYNYTVVYFFTHGCGSIRKHLYNFYYDWLTNKSTRVATSRFYITAPSTSLLIWFRHSLPKDKTFDFIRENLTRRIDLDENSQESSGSEMDEVDSDGEKRKKCRVK